MSFFFLDEILATKLNSAYHPDYGKHTCGREMSRKLVFIPVYNEQSHLPALYRGLREYYDGDVLFVDDGSQDQSGRMLKSLEGEKTKVIINHKNCGYGAALIRGFSEAVQEGYDYLVTMDSDEQHTPNLVPEFFDLVKDFDIVSGSRYYSEIDINDSAPLDRQKINAYVTKIINDITGFSLTDAFCGFKAYRVPALAKLSLHEKGYSMPLELWIQAKALRLSVTELPVLRVYQAGYRSFGGDLDDPSKRLAYYLETIQKERKRWKM